MLKYLFDLQFFAEGAEGGDGGDGGVATEGTASGAEIPARVPERAKKMYEAAVKANQPTVQEQPKEATTEEQPKHIPFSDLIKSDEYKEEHKAYMDKTISERFKKYKGVEEQNKQMSDALASVAVKYGIDPSDENYLASLSEAINKDDSYVESYAMEHDLSVEEARKSIDMKRKLEALEEEKRVREQQAAQQEQINLLLASAERTKALYPDFDLDVEMQNEKFRNLCAVTQGDTTAAYRAIHYDELQARQGLQTAQIATQQVANSVAANKARPIENGLSSQASAITTTDYSRMNLRQIREAAAEFKRHPERLK